MGNMHFLRTIGILFLFMHFVLSLPFINKCLEIKDHDSFDVQKFSGKWYEILRVNTTGPVTTKCHTESYAVPDETFVIISGEFLNQKTHKFSFIEGVAALDVGKPGKLIYNIPDARTTGVLDVIDTDYETFASLYICNTYEVYKSDFFWIISRERKLSKEIIEKLLAEYKDMGGELSSLIFIDQSNCPQKE